MKGHLRAGLIGLGVMGRNHARVLDALAGVELVALADPAGDPHEVARGRPVFRNAHDLAAIGLDYCVVAAPTEHHLSIGLELAEAGVNALIEKPLAHDSSAARELADAFAARGLLGAVGHIERYNPALQSARARLATGDLGTVFQIVTRRQGPYPGRIADVGVVKDLATHDIDLTAWVLQQPYVSVSAHTAHRSGRPHEDLVAAVGILANGVIASHLVNWLSPLKERLTVITGERGTLVADTLLADLTYYANGSTLTEWDDIARFRGVSEGDVTRFALSKPEPLRTQHEAFRDAVCGVATDIVTLEQGVKTVAVAESMLESATSGTAVEIRGSR